MRIADLTEKDIQDIAINYEEKYRNDLDVRYQEVYPERIYDEDYFNTSHFQETVWKRAYEDVVEKLDFLKENNIDFNFDLL